MSQNSRNTLQPFARTGRWIQGGVGVGAALATILASMHSCGVLGGQSSRLNIANLAVNWVGLTPAADTAYALGDTLRFAAIVTDARGTSILGARLDWSTEDPKVASVDSAGFVVARTSGVTWVVAKAGEHASRARIFVRQRVDRVELGDSALRMLENGTRGLDLRAWDRRGAVISARNAVWTVGDTAVAVVDERGVVTARAPGRTAVSAAFGGTSDSAVVEVLPVPARLVVVRGDAQRAGVGTRLPELVVLRVESRRGEPMAGVAVRLQAAEGFGRAEPESALTDAEGRVTAAWHLGDAPGPQRLVATAAGLDGATPLAAEAEPSAANTRIAVVGETPSGVAGAGQPVVAAVRVTDSLGRALAGVPVRWMAADGGSIVAREERTDSAGEARADWKLGSKAGTQRARVAVGSGRSVPPFAIGATVHAGAPARVDRIGDAKLDGAAGTALARPIMVRVTDSLGNPVAGIRLAVLPAVGSVADSAPATDSLGRAAVRWTLGPASGEQRLSVSADGLPRLRLVARARPGAAANLAFIEPPATAPAARALIRPLKLKVTDLYGNPLANQVVALTASAGTLAPLRAVTGKDGTVVAKWTLGAKPGPQVVTAAVAKTGVRQRIEVEAVGKKPAVKVVRAGGR